MNDLYGYNVDPSGNLFYDDMYNYLINLYDTQTDIKGMYNSLISEKIKLDTILKDKYKMAKERENSTTQFGGQYITGMPNPSYAPDRYVPETINPHTRWSHPPPNNLGINPPMYQNRNKFSFGF